MTLSARLTRYLESCYPQWIASGTLQKLTIEHAGQTGRTAVRRLQELVEDGTLEVEYRERNHAYYRAKHAKVERRVVPVVLPDGTRAVREVYSQ